MTLPRQLIFILSASLALVAGARADLTSPVLVQSFPSAMNLGRAAHALDLNAYIQDPNVPGTAVRITATVGTMGTYNIDMALTDQQTPLTVANFLAYIKAGAYTNNIIHRSIHGFIIQDGGYYFFADANGVHVGLVPTFPPVLNEFGISNVRGTVAMAKIGTDPNSATSQWFINMADNSANLNNQNGGFTVFGRVIGNGMAVADIIGNLTTHDASADLGIPDWTDVPFTTQPPPYLISSFVITSAAVVPSMTYNVTSANTSLVTATLSGNILTLTPSATLTGSTNITITATDLEGSSGSLTEPVNVVATYTYDLWKGLWPFANTTVSAETADPDGDKVPNLSKYAFGGDPLHAQAIPGLPQAESGGGVTFYHQQSASLSYAVYESIDLTNWTLIWQTSNGFSNSAVFNHTVNVVPGFDSVTIRDPASKPLRFWRVQVSRTL